MPFPTPFIAGEANETQRNTELALYVLRWLEHQRDPQERIWPGDRRLQTLQSTCLVLEALHELNLKGLTQHLIEPAANWLLELPLELPAEDLRAFRLFPSRFKVLAQLGKFDPARLNPDFGALCQLFDPNTGWIHDAPFDMHPTLVTMVWLETLAHLETAGLLAAEQKAWRERANQALLSALEAWIAKASAAVSGGNGEAEASPIRAGSLANSGDASYALALLIRFGVLKPDAPQVEQATPLLLEALRQRPPAAMRRAEPLYCARHLLSRHPQPPEIREEVQALINEFVQRYESGDAQHELLPIHALRVRLLLAYHGDALRTAVLEKLWQDTLAASEAEQRQEQEVMEAEFVDLIRHSIRVQLGPPQRITGTRARGEVYRLRFGLTTESTDERGAPLSTPRDTLRLIVKKGPPHVLAQSVQRYRSLPDPLQRLFARHADLAAGAGAGYLIMQDLAEMQPLSEVLAQLDRPVVLADERHRAVAEVAGAVADILQGLHGYDRRPSLIDHQLDVIYLAPMAVALEQLAQPLAFPELQQWLTTPPLVNSQRYEPLEHYLHALRHAAAQLEPRSLGYLHGDCHSRNVMLTRDMGEARFVDIETLATAQDYVVDYGLLLEDVAIYQSLPYGSERGRISWDEIVTGQADEETGAAEDWLTYPAFPSSEVVVAFQLELLRHLKNFAEELDDTAWQARLWLATARGLLLLASRQLSSHAVAPRRSHGPRYVNDARLVQLAFAEALRLLRELADHLDPSLAAPLPAVPFPGEQNAPPEASEAVTSLMTALAEALGADSERRAVTGQPQLADYVTRPGERLFARLYALDSQPVIYLAGRPEDFVDPQHLAAPLEAGDTAVAAPGLGTRARLDGPENLPYIMDLVRQARELAGRMG
jgi:hypothetical protein